MAEIRPCKDWGPKSEGAQTPTAMLYLPVGFSTVTLQSQAIEEMCAT